MHTHSTNLEYRVLPASLDQLTSDFFGHVIGTRPVGFVDRMLHFMCKDHSRKARTLIDRSFLVDQVVHDADRKVIRLRGKLMPAPKSDHADRPEDAVLIIDLSDQTELGFMITKLSIIKD